MAIAVFFGGLLGACVGSFCAATIYRSIFCDSVIFPARSFCPNCGTVLGPWELIPVVNYFILRGRCKHCKEKINPGYAVVEALGCIMGAALAWHFGLTPIFVMHLVVFAYLLCASGIDCITYSLSYGFLAFGLLSALTMRLFLPSPLDALIGLGVGFFSLWLVSVVYKFLRGRTGLGIADAFVFAMIGCFLGWQSLYPTLLIACLSSLFVAFFWDKRRLPFVPFLTFGAFLSAIFPGGIFMAFLRIFSFLLFGLFLAAPCHALDSVNFNPIPISITAQAGSGVPIGTVIAWPVSTNPSDIENWLECNGQSIAASVYPDLVALVGATVPDFRGLFLRGVGGNSAALGATQGDAIKQVDNTSKSFLNGNITQLDYQAGGAFSTTHRASGQYKGGEFGAYTNLTLDPTKFWSPAHTANEFRPVNKAVRYLIRAK